MFGIGILKSSYFHTMVTASVQYFSLQAAVDILPVQKKKKKFDFLSSFSFNTMAKPQALTSAMVWQTTL